MTVPADDGETPSADELEDQFDDEPVPRGDGRYTWLPVAGAALLAGALVLVAIVLNLGNGNDDPSYGKQVDTSNNLLCPKTYQQVTKAHPRVWVPVKPNQIKARNQLTSTKKPTNAVVCAYVATRVTAARLNRATVPLTGRHILSAKEAVALNLMLGRVRDGDNATGCADSGVAPEGDNYLIGFTYESGTLWVSAPGPSCDGATNGSFRTITNLRAVAATAFAQTS